MSMKKTALVVVASGSEDVEYITAVDVLRRASIEVTTASIHDTEKVQLQSRNTVFADTIIDKVKNMIFDVIIIPGGMKGSNAISDCPAVIEMLRDQKKNNRLYAAICAAPATVLHRHSLIDDVEAVAYPSFESDFKQIGKGRVCVSKNCVTSLGPGTATEFALKIVELLLGRDAALRLASGFLLHPSITF
ncbi:protein DJ-1, putative [Plasmodium vinckei vinckei]|uniref:Protein DJ-1, putative n=1 Tax=Plasmodium vinckei vinckei TaxID=54757 RepID=A0A449BVP4_PLAVN|nr:protein DJ-1, putative [Plasmodium vinckei vinckei]KEG02616.1 4-methyl-5(b-hydroxyethyl)-thiazole monophosphate biosynthesis protein [Plasmodium vinckei vinckei]VEV57389.1 protein DJ-1, putative [Plasmodium vinckei vinckei]